MSIKYFERCCFSLEAYGYSFILNSMVYIEVLKQHAVKLWFLILCGKKLAYFLNGLKSIWRSLLCRLFSVQRYFCLLEYILRHVGNHRPLENVTLAPKVWNNQLAWKALQSIHLMVEIIYSFHSQITSPFWKFTVSNNAGTEIRACAPLGVGLTSQQIPCCYKTCSSKGGKIYMFLKQGLEMFPLLVFDCIQLTR